MDIKKNSQDVTLLVGTFKQPELLKTTLKAMVRQTFTNLKILVIDDNSTRDIEIIKETQNIVNEFNDLRIKYVKNDFNIGVPAVFQKWINHVDTKYFYLTGAGDQLLPGAIEAMVQFLDDHNDASMVHGLETLADGKKEKSLFQETNSVDPQKYLEFHLIGGQKQYSWSQSSALFRTEFWRVNNIPVIHDHYWDHYFHCKYILLSKKIGYLNEYVAVREKSHCSYEEYVKKNYFIAMIERKYQSLKFINEHEFYMVKNGYPVSRYKYLISKQILKQSLLVNSPEEISYCIQVGLSNMTKLVFSTLLKYIFVLPARSFSNRANKS